MVAELTPGTGRPGEPAGGRADPDLPDAARRQPRRGPGRRSTPTRATTCSCCSATGRGAEGQRPRAGPDDPALRADRATMRARSTSSSPCGARTSAASIHNFSLLIGGAGDKDTQLAELRRRARTPCSRTLANQDANLRATLRELPSTLDETQTRAGQGRPRSATVLGPTLEDLRPGGARARAVAARDAPVPDRDDADHPRPAAPVHARGAADRARAAARRCATSSAATPDLTRSFRVVNALLNTLAYNPPGRRRGGLPVLAVVGQPRRRARCSPTQDAHGPIRRGLVVVSLRRPRSCSRQRRPTPTRRSARSSTCSTRRRPREICPAPRRPGSGGG